MKTKEILYSPIEGKTYSLFGNTDSTKEYYILIKTLADRILEINSDIIFVIDTIEKNSSKKRFLKAILNKPQKGLLISDCLNLVSESLNQYTKKTEEHLKSLSLRKFWDKRLSTTREQYHLYMLEIELRNRMNISRFKAADRKIALLPYCLQDFLANCKAAKEGFDYRCKHCSKICFQNQASLILEKNRVEPYIWMGGNIKKGAKNILKDGQTLGIIGIACIPELVWGMRKVSRYKLPVIGLPLNANRCVRWFGEFHPNSIDLNELEKLVAG